MIEYEKYMLIPYKPMGRDIDGCDCWGLICLILENEGIVSLPKDLVKSCATHDHYKSLYNCNWVELERQEPLCIGLCFSDDGRRHAVLFIDHKRFIEMSSFGPCVKRADNYHFQSFYRVVNV